MIIVKCYYNCCVKREFLKSFLIFVNIFYIKAISCFLCDRVAQPAHLACVVHTAPGTMFATFQWELCSQLTRSAVTGCREYSPPAHCLSGKKQRKGTPCQRYPQPCSNSRRERMSWPHLTTAPLEHLHIETGPYHSGWIMSLMQLILLHCRTAAKDHIMHLIICRHHSDTFHTYVGCVFWNLSIYLLQHPLWV